MAIFTLTRRRETVEEQKAVEQTGLKNSKAQNNTHQSQVEG